MLDQVVECFRDEPVGEGFLLPVGGHKGFGLALIVDILSGVITGGNFLNQLKSMYNDPNDPSLTCHLMAVINLSCIMDQGELKSRMGAFCKTVKQSPMWDKTGEVLLPGELEHRVSLKREEEGIPLPISLYGELVNLGHELGVSSSLNR